MNDAFAVEVLEWIEDAAKSSPARRVWSLAKENGATLCEEVRCVLGHSHELPHFVGIEFKIPLARMLQIPGVNVADLQTMRDLLPAVSDPPQVTVEIDFDPNLGECLKLSRKHSVNKEVTQELWQVVLSLTGGKTADKDAARQRFRDRIIEIDESAT